MKKKIAIITGACGQDGSYLTELLLEKDYKVYAVKRRSSSNTIGNLAHLVNESDLEIVEGDVTDLTSLQSLCRLARADEFYNLAAQSHVGTSFNQPTTTINVNALGVLNCLEAIRSSGVNTKFYQASTSEMFGGLSDEPTNENTPFHPRSPYGCAKLLGHWQAINYRETYKMFICCGILHNHESPRRGANFVTRKITLAIANILAGKQDKLLLGNIHAIRDWAHAKDMVRGMHLMMQHNKPDDYVLATGQGHSVGDFCSVAFEIAGLNPQDHIIIDSMLYRPAEVPKLIGDYEKAKQILGWAPTVSFNDLIKEMVESDIELVNKSVGS